MKHLSSASFLWLCIFVAAGSSGCSKPSDVPPAPPSAHDLTKQQNEQFLTQKTFDPWILKGAATGGTGAYLAQGGSGTIFDAQGKIVFHAEAGRYVAGVIFHTNGTGMQASPPAPAIDAVAVSQQLDLQAGTFRWALKDGSTIGTAGYGDNYWPTFWHNADVQIDGDPEAQQVAHANLFYLTSSLKTGSSYSIPPMGLSSATYNGRIFWDAEIWMFPSLIVQHPDLARSIIDYRYKLLPQAMKNAKAHGFKGAEYPWESANDGKEWAPAEFSQERHITADVAFATWQYYRWTGDTDYLKREGFPILKANADYWASRVTLGTDGKYHIKNVIGPDETIGVVDDDAWTNGVVQATLRAAVKAATVVGQAPDPKWAGIAAKMMIPYDAKLGQYLEYPKMDIAHHQAKQADTQMLIYPLNLPALRDVAGKTLDYYLQHTITVGPAMTSSINAVIAARLGRAQQSLDLFHDSYRPFMRAPFDAFSEKRTTSNVYFCTGMGGCLQCLYYGFGGLQVVEKGKAGHGTLIASSGDAGLYADPHLPPGWTGLTIKGVQFRGKKFDVTVGTGNVVSIKPLSIGGGGLPI